MKTNMIYAMIFALAMAFSGLAQTTLISEDLETPDLANGAANPAFTGWTWTNGNSVKIREAGSSGAPGSTAAPKNQTLQFEWTNAFGTYDVPGGTHTWAAGRAYDLTINSSPSSWNGSQDRFIKLTISETGGPELWTETQQLPYYDNSFSGQPWGPSQTFSFLVFTDNFIAGTAGNPITLKVESTGFRGLYWDNVLLTEDIAVVDNTAPTPNPMTFSSPPALSNGDTISMTADSASDPSGVEYLFQNTTLGNDSGWQNSTTWVQSGLNPADVYTYQYQVTARDKSPNQNATTPSALASAPVDATPPTPSPMTWSVEPAALGLGCDSVTMTASTASDINGVEYYFAETSGNPGGSDSGWQTSPTYVDTGLNHSTVYTYTVTARDQSLGQNATTASAAKNVTSPVAPGATLLDEDFEVPVFANGVANPGYIGWALTSTKSRNANNSADVPGAQAIPNHVIQFEQNNSRAAYDICYDWVANKAMTLTVNASPSSWNGTHDRFFKVTLSEQGGPDLWTQTSALPHYNSFGRQPWGPTQTFEYLILTDTFAGTPGSSISLEIERDSGTRGFYIDNVSLTVADPPTDNDPPTPDPMTWAQVPVLSACDEITMTATAALDPSTVEYYFTETSGNPGADDSGWQDSTSYTDTGLSPNTSYTYTVTARDKSPAQNATAASSAESASTPAPNSLVLINEDFQTPTVPNNTSNPGFQRWTWAGNAVKSKTAANTADLPVDTAGDDSNQAIQFEWTASTASYDVCHNWAADDTYSVSLNATPSSWNGATTRYVVATLLQQDNTELWTSGNTLLPIYNNFGGNVWTPAQTFTFPVDASAFGAGTPGQPLRLRITSEGSRGIYIDNVSLDIVPPVATVIRIR